MDRQLDKIKHDESVYILTSWLAGANMKYMYLQWIYISFFKPCKIV